MKLRTNILRMYRIFFYCPWDPINDYSIYVGFREKKKNLFRINRINRSHKRIARSTSARITCKLCSYFVGCRRRWQHVRSRVWRVLRTGDQLRVRDEEGAAGARSRGIVLSVWHIRYDRYVSNYFVAVFAHHSYRGEPSKSRVNLDIYSSEKCSDESSKMERTRTILFSRSFPLFPH